MQNITFNQYEFQAFQSTINLIEINEEQVLQVVKNPSVEAFDEPTYAVVEDLDFHNGTIEVSVQGRLLPDAPDFARGFLGIAFRINHDHSQYESIYVRPTNGRTEDQVRRNHAIQYYAYPDFKFDILRKTEPEKYESHADFGLNEWIYLKIVVHDDSAKLYVNDNNYPSLIVNDMKLGANASGRVALWAEVGTDALFKDLKITQG